MNIQQAQTRISQEFSKYLSEIGQTVVKEYKHAKSNKENPPPVPIAKKTKNSEPIIQQKHTPTELPTLQTSELINFEDYKFEKKSDQVDWKQQLQHYKEANLPIYHKKFGYCIEQSKFDAIMERFILLRKSLHKKKQITIELDDFIPIATLQQLAKQLPLEQYEINRILDDSQCAESFLKEIKYFVKSLSIDKSLIFYHPRMFEIDTFAEDLDFLLEQFEEIEKRKSDSIGDITFAEKIRHF